MERVYPLNYLKQLSNCSPVSSGNISLLKLLHKTMSVQALTMPVLKRALVSPFFASTPSKPGTQVRDEAVCLCLCLILPENKTHSEGRRELGHLSSFLEVPDLRVDSAGWWLHKSLQKSLRARCVLEINITIVGLQENGFGQPGSQRRENDWAESLAKTLWRSSFSGLGNWWVAPFACTDSKAVHGKNHCRAQEDHQGFLPQPQNVLGIAAEWLHAGTLLLLLHSTADPHVALSYLGVNICLL